MSKKFTPPHSDDAIKAAERDRDAAQLALNLANDRLDIMRQENGQAKEAEEIRKARVMTPTMLDVLKLLAKGELITCFHGWGHNSKPSYDFKSSGGKLSTAIFDRLWLAGYLETTKAGHVINEAGLATLEKAKGEKP